MSYTHLFTGEQSLSDNGSPRAVRYRVLLVDDEPHMLSALRRVFHQENYDITTCQDPREALELIKRENFQLIISDYIMPGMNGGELLKQARLVNPNMIRIMMTGHADVNAVVSAVKIGAVYKFILKPWNDDDLRVTVALALEQYDLVQKNNTLQQKIKEIEQSPKFNIANRSKLTLLLSKKGLLSNEQIHKLVELQTQYKTPMIKLIIDSGWLTEKVIHNLLSKELEIQLVTLNEFKIDLPVAALIPSVLCQQQLVIPLSASGKQLTLGMADPLDAGLVEDLRFITGLEIKPVLASIAEIQAKISEVYKIGVDNSTDFEVTINSSDPYEGIEIVIEDEQSLSIEDLLKDSDEPPAIRLVNSILLEAIRLNASDIHIQPQAKNVVVRLRIDGILLDKIQIPHAMHQSLVSRIKVMAGLDIAERRRPQDGRITVKTPKRVVDVRISTLPTINGEKVVMRILDRNSTVLSLNELGFELADLEKIRQAANKPQGIILATGPTGSGKTTTLYSLLHRNATAEKNYITIEDPVEYYLDSAGQVLVKEKIGLTFPLILRAILRQDPDVILIGEIRDLETAEVAFHAALTGHQVFSTLHTNSALATLSRLLDFGLKPFVVATALQAIIAQRLLRRICEHCREKTTADTELLKDLGEEFLTKLSTTYKGKGCPTCHNTGYLGRVGLYEVLLFDDHIRHLVANRVAITKITQYAQNNGFITMRESALVKIQNGLTTPEEVFRVLGTK